MTTIANRNYIIATSSDRNNINWFNEKIYTAHDLLYPENHENRNEKKNNMKVRSHGPVLIAISRNFPFTAKYREFSHYPRNTEKS